MDRLTLLEQRVDMLQQAFLQAQANQVPITGKVDSTANRVTDITPQTFTQTASIDDTSVTFEGIPSGYMTVYCPVNYTTTRDGDRVTVEFDALTEVAEITLSII